MTGLSFVKGRFGLGTDQRKPWVFITLALLIGPGILVHLVAKENWDRPRPRSVQEFGGQKDFIPAFIPAAMIKDQPGQNKSFLSGHAAMGFYLMVLAWVFRRRSWFYAGLAMGLVVSFGRVLQGGHFISDLIFAGYLCYFTYRLLSYWILGYSRILPIDIRADSNLMGKKS
jgi:lipid A 4'-phosphatase